MTRKNIPTTGTNSGTSGGFAGAKIIFTVAEILQTRVFLRKNDTQILRIIFSFYIPSVYCIIILWLEILSFVFT